MSKPTIAEIKADNINQVMPLLIQAKPLVIRGLCRHWPLTQAGLISAQAACDYLMQFYQGRPISANILAPKQQGRVFYNDDLSEFNFHSQQVDLGTFLQQIQAENDHGLYMASTTIEQWFTGLAQHNSFNFEAIKPLASLWIGNQINIAAHYDFPHNFACNLVGSRTFTLLPPEQVKHLYVGPMGFAPGGQEISLIDFNQVDHNKFPHAKQALEHAVSVTLDAGDVLYIPSMWWHQVQSHQPLNILLTHWWRDSPAYLGRPTDALLHAILSLRNLPKAQRQAWQALFNHYIFEHDQVEDSHIPDSAKGILKQPLDETSARQLRAELLNKLKR